MKRFLLYRAGSGFARTVKKKASATALGPSSSTAARGILARFTPITLKVLIGSRIKGEITEGRICVPVLMSQPAFMTLQVQRSAAITVTQRKTHFWAQRKYKIASRISIVSRTATSERIHSRYSPNMPIRCA